MTTDEAIQNIKIVIFQLRIDDSFDEEADKLESSVKVIETALIELKDKAEYWERLKAKEEKTKKEISIKEFEEIKEKLQKRKSWDKDRFTDTLGRETKSDLSGLAKYLDNA